MEGRGGSIRGCMEGRGGEGGTEGIGTVLDGWWRCRAWRREKGREIATMRALHRTHGRGRNSTQHIPIRLVMKYSSDTE